jgi:hypothetical protein
MSRRDGLDPPYVVSVCTRYSARLGGDACRVCDKLSMDEDEDEDEDEVAAAAAAAAAAAE